MKERISPGILCYICSSNKLIKKNYSKIFRFSKLYITGVLGTGAWLLLAMFANILTPSSSTLLFLLTHYALASPDVIIDGSVTDRIQLNPTYASDLQSLSWGSLALGNEILRVFSF